MVGARSTLGNGKATGMELQARFSDVGGVSGIKAIKTGQDEPVASQESKQDKARGATGPSLHQDQHIDIVVALCLHTSIASSRNASLTLTMAPVEPDAHARSNVGPYLLFSGHVLLVITLTFSVLDTARRAAKALPPATKTRTQQPLRRNYAILFSTLAFLSLASVASFSIIWRIIEYIRWAEDGKRDSPNSLWSGWYATEDVKWHIGDWVTDVDLVKEWSLVSISTPEGFLYTSQQYVGLLASAIFMGIEGGSRLPPLS